MQRDVEQFVKHQCACVKQKKPTVQPKEELFNISTSCPFELISIDFMHLEQSVGGQEYVMVVVDHFTRYAVCYATKNKSGKTAANNMFNDFVLRYGWPARIMHDQGGEFENELFTQLETLSGVKKSRTTPYQGRRNGYSRYSDRCTEYIPNFVGLGEIFLLRRSREEARRVSKPYSLSKLELRQRI